MELWHSISYVWNFFNQKYDNVFGKTRIGVTLNISKSSHRLFNMKYVPDIDLHNIPYVNKSDMTTG